MTPPGPEVVRVEFPVPDDPAHHRVQQGRRRHDGLAVAGVGGARHNLHPIRHGAPRRRYSQPPQQDPTQRRRTEAISPPEMAKPHMCDPRYLEPLWPGRVDSDSIPELQRPTGQRGWGRGGWPRRKGTG
jgi:hypothetical protein